MAVQPTGGRPASGPGRAELLAALSLAIDLGLGQPMEHMLRSSLIAARLADRLGLAEQQPRMIFYANLVCRSASPPAPRRRRAGGGCDPWRHRPDVGVDRRPAGHHLQLLSLLHPW